ncbi:hypothetical protein CQA53_01540 [Helicobacter didelphidarum]|uniref:Uncharacterized protein n=1 Tax=Helicobacter didelphidarum TaxID=2040648 RepID=A0A3D8IPY0_9HELI|nr:hypothetical protein [Helicobacter didelphidarum]RDU66975.1 hypothetical protein CQA53_01540 [Helicobacter didelphidarum]
MFYFQFYRIQIFFIFLTFIYIFLLVSCASSTQSIQDRDNQILAIEDKLQNWELSNTFLACDDCNFYIQEGISKRSEKVHEGHTGVTRTESGVKVYRFENTNLDNAFLTLLNSNIFAERMNRQLKTLLIESIQTNKVDFNEKNGTDEINFKAFYSLSYAKRLKNNSSLPRAMLDSVSMTQKRAHTQRFSDSLEGYIVGDQIVILHFYSEGQVWKRE